jgi:hypothetical protein
VYPPHGKNVNPPASVVPRSSPILLLIVVAASITSGCTSVRPTIADTYLIGPRYDVDPMFMEFGRQKAADAVRRDFRRIAQLGSSEVVLRHMDDADRKLVLNLAQEAGLRAIVPLRSFDYYARTGRLPDGCRNETNLVRSLPADITGHPGFAAVVVTCPPGHNARRRCTALMDLLAKRALPGVTIADRDVEARDTDLAMIDAAALAADLQASVLEHWLAQYHEALIQGRTAGVVLGRYRRPADDPRGLGTAGEAPKSADLAAIKELATRARHWGTYLRGARPEAIVPAAGETEGLSLATLIHGKRRLVLVFNESTEHYARKSVALPGIIGGKEIVRAVEVPPNPSAPAGQVIPAHRGRVTLPVALRPGDAALFEIF